MNIKKNHVSEQVLTYLRKKIMLNELKEGDHLKESELSKRLNVSRGPIREAIAKLEAERLVETPSNGRTVVGKFDVRAIKNLYDSRILLEKHALTQIDSESLTKHIDTLNLYIKQMQDSHSNGIRDVESDMAFHGLLVKMTNNQTLIQLWNSLNGLIETLIEVTSAYISIHQQEIIEEHQVVVDALKKQEVEKAQELLAIHLENASDYYCQAIKELNLKGVK
ncbi:GntR family transcriptional regulator [Oceanobacillus damuensis]|uniref:GntR family transcriptional regulator n=1 Tax=Oceanobacillus damuensis TaxID=937928 RepID=UPI000834866A|nr:GntR family transcriptional regulator [Oceanobacillus damuensis]